MDENKKTCPLRPISDPDSCSFCEGERCAWYVRPEYYGPEGRCAITYLGDIARAVWAK